MRKWICGGLLFILIGMLVGCKNNIPNGLDSEEHLKRGKKVITVGIMYDDGLLQPMIDSYNAENDTYFVELKSYESYENPCERFLLDVASGNAPDIIEVGQDFPADLLMEKGMLASLEPFFEKDAEWKESDLLDNVLEALKTDDELYYICDGVGLDTLLAKTSEVGSRNGWNEEEMMEYLSTKPENQKLFQLNAPDEILAKLFRNNTSGYVDWENGKCTFDTPEFQNLLETAKRGDGIVEEDVSIPKLLQDGEVLFYDLNNSGIMGTISSCDIFKEPVTAIGYPCADKDGSYFYLHHAFGICAQSENPEGAWDFLRTLVSKEHQERMMVELGATFIPTRKDVFDRMLSDRQITEEYEDEYGYRIEPFSYSESYGDYTISYGPLTDEQIQKFLTIFNNTNKVETSNNVIWNIVSEETKAYYKGEKNIDETTKVIQNRIDTYINEQQ